MGPTRSSPCEPRNESSAGRVWQAIHRPVSYQSAPRQRAVACTREWNQTSIYYCPMTRASKLSNTIALVAAATYVLALSVPCNPTFMPMGNSGHWAFSKVADLAASKTLSSDRSDSGPNHPNSGARPTVRSAHHAPHAMAHEHAKAPSHPPAEMAMAYEHPDPRRSELSEEPATMVAPCLCGCDQPVSAMVEVRSPGQLVPGATTEQIARPPRDPAPTYSAMMIERLVVQIEHVPIPA